MNRYLITLIALILSPQLYSYSISDHQRMILQRNFLSRVMTHDNDIGALLSSQHPFYQQLYLFVSRLDQPSIITQFIQNNSQQALLYYIESNRHLISIDKNYIRISYPLEKNDHYYVKFKINPTTQGQLIMEGKDSSIQVLGLELLAAE